MDAKRKTKNKKKLRRQARAQAFAKGTTLAQAAPTPAASEGPEPILAGASYIADLRQMDYNYRRLNGFSR